MIQLYYKNAVDEMNLHTAQISACGIRGRLWFITKVSNEMIEGVSTETLLNHLANDAVRLYFKRAHEITAEMILNREQID